MDAKDHMTKLDISNDRLKLSQAQLDYMKILEKQNIDRVTRLKRLRRNNLLTGVALLGGVLSIYAYSIFAVKQEKFLDEVNDSK
jgi:hypothetical protein